MTVNLIETICQRISSAKQATEILDPIGPFLKDKEFSKLIGILRCAIIQVFDQRVSVEHSVEQPNFLDFCKKYEPNRIVEVSFTELQGHPQDPAPAPVGKGLVIYIPKMRFHPNVLHFFQDFNRYDKPFNELDFQCEPTLVVRIKRVYNLLLKLENLLSKAEKSVVEGAYASICTRELQALFTDLFNLDIDLLPLLLSLSPGLKDFFNSIASLAGMSIDKTMLAHIQQWTAAENLSGIGSSCGLFLGMLFSQTHPEHQSLIGLQDIYKILDATIDAINNTSRTWCNRLVKSFDASPGEHHVNAIKKLQKSTKEFLTAHQLIDVVEQASITSPFQAAGKQIIHERRAEKQKSLAKNLLKDEFFDKLGAYVAEIQGHFGSLMTSIAGDGDFVSLKFSSFLNLKKLYQLVALIKLVSQNVYHIKDKVKTLEEDYKNALLLLLTHLKYDVLLSAINYVDVLRIKLFLEATLPDCGVSLTDTLEIYIQKFYQTVLSNIEGVCPFEDHPHLECLLDETFNARRQELALKKCANIHGEDLDLRTIETHFNCFKDSLSSWKSQAAPEPQFPPQYVYDILSLPQETLQTLKRDFNISHRLLKQYYPQFADDFRQVLENRRPLSESAMPRDFSLVYAKLQQEQAHYELQQEMIGNFIDELSNINRSTLSFFKLPPNDKEGEGRHLLLLEKMKSNHAICAYDNHYALLNKLDQTSMEIEPQFYHVLEKICEKFSPHNGVFFRFKPHDCQELATLLGRQKDFFLDGCPITDDVLELKVQELSTDISTLSKAKLIDVYSAYQVQLTQLNSYNKYCEDWFTLLERYSQQKDRLDKLSPDEFAQLRYFFSMAKPLLKLAYEESQWQELLCGLHKQGNLGLVNMRSPHQSTVGKKKDELDRLLIAQQEKVAQAYQQEVIACARTTTIEPDLRKDKLIRHENCSKFFEQVMQFIRTEIPNYLSPALAAELELKNGALLYPLSTPYVRIFSMPDPMLILKLPKQVADLMWLYNCLFHLHKLAKVMEEATGTVGFGHYGSETKIAGTFLLEVMQLCLYGRPSAQPGFHQSQPRIFIKGYTNSRTTSSTWMLQEWWNSTEGRWSDLQQKMRRENPSLVPPAPNEHAKIDQKHNFRILIEQIYFLPFLVKYYTGQHQAQPRDVAQLHEKSSRLATHIEGAFNLSWNSFLFELPNLWQCLNGVCQLMHESNQSINQLTYQHFELIRTEMYKIYAAVDALEIDIGLKEGSLLSMVEPFLEAFTQKLLQAMQMPLEQYLKIVSKQDVYAYRFQKLEDEVKRLEQDRNELEIVSGRLDTFLKLPRLQKTVAGTVVGTFRYLGVLPTPLSSQPSPHTAGLRDIYQIIEQYAFVRPSPAVMTESRIIEEDAGFHKYYLDNREDLGLQDIAQDGQSSAPPQKFVFPNDFISFVTLVQAYISGRRESVRIALEMHLEKMRMLTSKISHISDRQSHITAYYESQKEFLITKLERDFAQSKSVSVAVSFLKYRPIKTLKDQYSEKIKSHFSGDFIDCVLTKYAQKVQEAEVEFQRVTEECSAEFRSIESKLKPNAQILEKINELKADLIQKKKELESSWTEDQSTKTRKLALLNQLVLDLTRAEDCGNGQRIFNEVTEQYKATFEATTLQFKRRREILEKIHDFKTYLTQLKEVVDSSWTEDNDTIIEKLALLCALEKTLLKPDFTFAYFNEQLSYPELTKMCRADTWMRTLIQYALYFLECIGLVKSQRHSFFYTLSDITEEGLGEEQNMASTAPTDFTYSVA